MFCPDCGTENQRSQKFCTRCGKNLFAVDRGYEGATNIPVGPTVNQPNASTILKVVALISVMGFLTVTGGSIFLMLIDRGRTPIPLFFGFGGLIALVLICRHLLRLISGPAYTETPRPTPAPTYIAPPVPAPRGNTNRRLSDAAVPYQSIIEERTRQFETER